MKKIVLGFISDTDPKDRRPWSGTKNKLYEQIKGCTSEVIWIKVSYNWQTVIYRAFLLLFSIVCGKRYSSIHTTFIAKRLSKSIRKSDLDKVDVLFAPSGSQYLYLLKTDKPIIYLADATFKSIYNYYPLFDNFFSFNIKQGNLIEKVALEKAWRVIASSEWCKNSMINDYNINPSVIRTIEFGANVDEKDIEKINCIREENKLNLLFLAVEWERKGGDIAVECVQELNLMGIDANLYIVGQDLPQKYASIVNVYSIGFLNKNIPEEYNRFLDIIQQSDILLLPTKAECSAIAFCEASAYGLPVFTYDTGGISNYVENGINGYRLPLNARGKDFADKIKEVIDSNEFTELSVGGRSMYKEKLNWHSWQKAFKLLLDELCESVK